MKRIEKIWKEQKLKECILFCNNTVKSTQQCIFLIVQKFSSPFSHLWHVVLYIFNLLVSPFSVASGILSFIPISLVDITSVLSWRRSVFNLIIQLVQALSSLSTLAQRSSYSNWWQSKSYPCLSERLVWWFRSYHFIPDVASLWRSVTSSGLEDQRQVVSILLGKFTYSPPIHIYICVDSTKGWNILAVLNVTWSNIRVTEFKNLSFLHRQVPNTLCSGLPEHFLSSMKFFCYLGFILA